MTDISEKLVELEGLVANRTWGEWIAQLASDSLHLTRVYNDEGSTICASIRAKDARLIVWLVNNAPALLRQLRSDLEFCARWAATKPDASDAEARKVIAHYPPIKEIVERWKVIEPNAHWVKR